MSELQEALKSLYFVDWEDVPLDDLPGYLGDLFNASELIINSVPPMPDKGTAYNEASPHFSSLNQATSHKEIVASSTRSPQPHPSHEELQKHWGKPIKISAKENPLQVSLYKMAGHDRRGAWFARKSVHEGIGFAKFKAAMLREFPESLLVQGPPGAGAKRGLGAERRVEQIDVPSVGTVEVYQLSAQMPSPVSPRDFLTLVLSTDNALTEKSAATLESGEKIIPRHFMLVSKPTAHPDAPLRSSFVRGQYESVEIIREIPIHPFREQTTGAQQSGEGDSELNPVEWIMITRSDPGGGIPRFMVERGTPGAMLGDLSKFFDWACSQEVILDRDADKGKQEETSLQNSDLQREETDSQPTLPNGDTAKDAVQKPVQEAIAPAVIAQNQSKEVQPQESSQPEAPGGVVTSLTTTLEAGLAAYAPTSVSNYVHDRLHPNAEDEDDLLDDESDTSSDSFMSADELRRLSTAPENLPQASSENVSLASNLSAPNLAAQTGEKLNPNRHDKELRRIAQKRDRLEQDLAKKREAEEAKFRQSQEKEQSAQDKAKEMMDKEMRKADERHRKEMERLEAKRIKEAQKAEDKRRKKEESNKLSMVARERDDLRSQLDLFRRENTLLQTQVENLQRENTALAGRLGKLVGPDALKDVHDEIGGGRSRAATVKSTESRLSLNSAASGSTKS